VDRVVLGVGADLHTLIPDGDAHVRAVIECWGLRWPDDA
jgi:hypothetical protein